MATSKRYSAANKAKKTYSRFLGILTKSGLEGRVIDGLCSLGIEVEYEAYTYPIDYLPGGQYTPDLVTVDPYTGGQQVIEIKGWANEKEKLAAKAFREKADDPNDPQNVTSFVIVWKDRIDLHRDGKDYAAGLYTCEECGEPYIAPLNAPACPKCHDEHPHFHCTNINDWYNKEYEKVWRPNWEEAVKELHENEEQAKTMETRSKFWRAFYSSQIETLNWNPWYRKRANNSPEIGLVEGRHEACVASPTERSGYYTPDFVYYEVPAGLELFGTTLAPMVFVSVDFDPTPAREQTFETIREYVLDWQNPLVKHVRINDDGIQVLDETTDGLWRRGHEYHCKNPKCGQMFFASDEHRNCPHCNGTNVSVSDGNSGEHGAW